MSFGILLADLAGPNRIVLDAGFELVANVIDWRTSDFARGRFHEFDNYLIGCSSVSCPKFKNIF